MLEYIQWCLCENGHCGTVTCLDLHEEQFVSGGRDGMVKGESQD